MNIIPRYALHEQGLQRQKSIGPLVSSQERRALTVSRVNRTFCSSSGLDKVSFVRTSEKETYRCLLGRTDPPASSPASPRPATPPRCAPPRPNPPVVCPGFGLDRYLSNPKLGRTAGGTLRGGSEQGVTSGSGLGASWAGRRGAILPWKDVPLRPPARGRQLSGTSFGNTTV